MIGWSFIKELDTLQREVDNIFGTLVQEQSGRGTCRSAEVKCHYPRITLSEDVDNFYLAALIPGINPSDLDINLTGNSLALSGERVQDEGPNTTWQRQERSQGKFLRTLELPLEVDTANISAEYADGVLRVLLPKTDAVKPKRISIKTVN